MRNWKILLLLAAGGVIFFILMVFGPTKRTVEPVFQDIFLVIFAVAGVSAYMYELSFKYTHRMYCPGYSWTLHQENAIDEVIISDKEGKPQTFCIYRLGGCRLIPVGGPTHGVMIARKDLIFTDEGDYTNVMVRSVPDVYRTNYVADDYELPLDSLSGEFLAILERRNLIKNGLPVYYARDPLGTINVNDAVSKEGIPYKSLYDQKCNEANTLTAMVKNLGSNASNISRASALQSKSFVARHTPKKSPILKHDLLTPAEEEDEQ